VSALNNELWNGFIIERMEVHWRVQMAIDPKCEVLYHPIYSV
jgi:hypothetical protein